MFHISINTSKQMNPTKLQPNFYNQNITIHNKHAYFIQIIIIMSVINFFFKSNDNISSYPPRVDNKSKNEHSIHYTTTLCSS